MRCAVWGVRVWGVGGGVFEDVCVGRRTTGGCGVSVAHHIHRLVSQTGQAAQQQCPAAVCGPLTQLPACLLARPCSCLRPGNYQPTPTHHFVRLLHDKGLLLRCFTQNIDSLEHQVCGQPGGGGRSQHGLSGRGQRGAGPRSDVWCWAQGRC